jgi:hypothetical protein
VVKKQTRLAAEIRRLLKVNELTDRLRALSPQDLAAIERLLVSRRGVGAAGAERKYSDGEGHELRLKVRYEMQRLEDAGVKRYGAKTAIRSLVMQALTTERGTASVASNPALVERVCAEWFRIWEAGRKRG